MPTRCDSYCRHTSSALQVGEDIPPNPSPVQHTPPLRINSTCVIPFSESPTCPGRSHFPDGAFFALRRQRKPHLRGVRVRCGGVRNKQHGYAVHACGPANLLHFIVPAVHRSRCNIANVDRANARGMACRDRGVDLRVLLAAVANQHKREVGVIGQQLLYVEQLVAGVPACFGVRRLFNAIVAQEERPGGNGVKGHEVNEQIVQVPGAAGDIEDGVEGGRTHTALQRGVECGHTREGEAGARMRRAAGG